MTNLTPEQQNKAKSAFDEFLDAQHRKAQRYINAAWWAGLFTGGVVVFVIMAAIVWMRDNGVFG